MRLPRIIKAELNKRIENELNAMPQHKGKKLRTFITRTPNQKWSIGLHGGEQSVALHGQALLDAQAISKRMETKYDLVNDI